MLREKLFDKIPTIATSATLAVGGDFRFYRGACGLDAAKEAVLPLSFDYREHALLYVPRMRREPAFGAASGPYSTSWRSEMRELVRHPRGAHSCSSAARMRCAASTDGSRASWKRWTSA